MTKTRSKQTSTSYRPPSSYQSKDPAKRQRQIDNLRCSQKDRSVKKGKSIEPIAKTKSLDAYKNDPIGFIEAYFYIPEGRKLIQLLSWQKEILTELFLSEPRPNMAILGQPKKTGKSTFAAAVALWYLITKPMSEIYLLASSAGQSQLVCFDKMMKAIRMNPVLVNCCGVTKDRIEYRDSFVQILAPNVAVAGLNPSLVIAEELWSWTGIEHKRAWDELTNPPTRPDENLNLVTSYAGFAEDEDSILWHLYQQGMKMQDGEVEKDEGLWFRWYGKELYEQVPWVKPGYLKQQEKRMRTNTFRRMHCNEWASGIEVFIDPETIDFCVPDPQYRPGGRWIGGVALGVDLGYKHDCSAICGIGRINERKLILLNHRLFVPPIDAELNIEATVEKQIEQFAMMYDIRVIYFDPFQMARSAQTLLSKGRPMVEFAQTGNNCVMMTETLQGLFKTRCIQLYNDVEIRKHLLAANVKESVRGYRLVKRRQAQKIDLSIALALAAQAAVDRLGPGDFGSAYLQRTQGQLQEVADTDYLILG